MIEDEWMSIRCLAKENNIDFIADVFGEKSLEMAKKIDVDGIEHLILEGGDKFLSNKKVKSLSVEINENFEEQYEKVLNLMKEYEFKILHKKHNEDMFSEGSRFKKVYNYIFIKQK